MYVARLRRLFIALALCNNPSWLYTPEPMDPPQARVGLGARYVGLVALFGCRTGGAFLRPPTQTDRGVDSGAVRRRAAQGAGIALRALGGWLAL